MKTPRQLAHFVASARAHWGFARALLGDADTPRMARWCIGAALAYLAMPFDLIPDVIPILGHLDDLLICGTLFTLAYLLIPNAVIEKHRKT